MKTAKIFKNGQSQVVRLPKEFYFEGSEVFVKKSGNAIILLPIQNPWEALFNNQNKFSDDFMEARDQPAQQERG